MRLRTVIKPESTQTERLSLYGMAIFIIGPFAVGIFIENYYLLASLPLGFVLIGIFHALTDGKFQYHNWIQYTTLQIDQSSITYNNRSEVKQFNWNDMINLHISITGYDGESRSTYGDSTTLLTGVENSIRFSHNSQVYNFDFYIDKQSVKKELLLLLKEKISPCLKNGVITVLTSGSNGYRTFTPREFMEYN